MVLPKSEVDFSAEDNVADDTTLVKTELSKHPVAMDVAESDVVPQREHRVEESGKIVVSGDEANRGEHMVKELETEKIVVGNDEVNRDKTNVAEEDGEGEEHYPDKEEEAIQNEVNDADEEGNSDELAAEEDGDMDNVDNDEYDYGDGDGVDVDVYDYDDVDANGDDDDDVGADDDDDDDDEEFDVDEDDLLEEDGDVEHKESNVYEDEDDKENTAGGESEKVENEEKGGGSLEPNIKKLVKKNVKKEVVKRDSCKVTSKSEDKSERDGEKGPMVEGDEENAKEEIEEKGEGSAPKKVKRLRKNNRRKVSRGNSEKMDSKQEDKLELARIKKTSKKVKSMGMIFMCSSKTKKDCYRYKVLGLPESKRDIVEKIYKGMRLFLYDVDLKLMYGIYKAAGPGGYNIEPKAFKSQFPSQVRFTVLDDCVPLAEEKFKKVIKENYFTRTKFDCQLKADQVKKLCKLFVAASKGPRSKRSDRGLKEKTRAPRNRDRPRARPLHESRASRKLDRPRARPLDESRASRKRDRATARALDEERYTLDEKHQYLGYPHMHQREVIASSLAPLSQIAPLRPPATAPSYAYDRTMEIDAYRRNVLVDHRDAYRREAYIQPPLEHRDAYRRETQLEHRDAYRREPQLEHLDVYRMDPLLNHRDSYRRDAVIEHRDLRPVNLEARHLDEMGRHDAYMPYRERQSYHDPVYVEHLSRDHDRHQPGGLRSEYRLRETALPEYRSTRARYRY